MHEFACINTAICVHTFTSFLTKVRERKEMEKRETKAIRQKKGFWKPEEDFILRKYVETHGEGNWTIVSKNSGVMRGAKSCRLRWKNYLRPNIKRGIMSQDEKDLILRLHKLLGNRWSLIAGRLPGRTDNEVKNYWNTHLNKKPCPRPQAPPPPPPPQPQNPEAASSIGGEMQSSMITDSWLENLIKMNGDHGMNVAPPPDDYSSFFHNCETFLDDLVPFGCGLDRTIFL